MNRFHLLMVGLTLAGLWFGTPCSHAGEKKHHGNPVQPPSVSACYDLVGPPATSPTAAEDRLVQELVKILDETPSPQTLLATTLALMPMGKKAQSAVPAIIRNAERLKVFLPLKNMSSAKAENATIVLEAILVIQMDLPLTKEMLGVPGGPFGQVIQSATPCPAPSVYPPSAYGIYGVCPVPPTVPGAPPPQGPVGGAVCPVPNPVPLPGPRCAPLSTIQPEPIPAPRATGANYYR